MEPYVASSIQPISLPMLSKAFKGIIRIMDEASSFYASISCSLIFSLLKHKASEAGQRLAYVLYTSIGECLELAPENKDLQYFQQIVQRIVHQVSQESSFDFVMALISTDQALPTLAQAFCRLYNYLIGKEFIEFEPVSFKFNKSQLKKLIKAILPSHPSSHPPNQTGLKQTMLKAISPPSL